MKFIFGEIPPTNTGRLFYYGDNKFRAISVSSPLSIQAPNKAYLTINADCYTKSEVNSNLALKQHVINSVPGTGGRLFEVNFLKRIFAIAPLHVKTYSNLKDPDDPKNANIELNIDSIVISQQTQDAFIFEGR